MSKDVSRTSELERDPQSGQAPGDGDGVTSPVFWCPLILSSWEIYPFTKFLVLVCDAAAGKYL